MVENDTVVLCHEEIGPAVAVVIPHCRTHPISSSGNASFFCYVRETSVAVVSVKCVAQRGLGIEEITLAAVNQVNVHPTIIVIINECAPSTHGFRQVHLRRPPIMVYPIDPADFRWHKFKGEFAATLRHCDAG